jgi:putative Mg2+ transporter-C (MgtC) family protein
VAHVTLDYLDVLARIGMTVLLAGAIGLERELNTQPAGLRTHVLVGLGAMLFTVAGASIVGSDPTRVAAQVASGIGFIGAGAILRDAGRIKGLTTAASLWAVAAVGLTVGFGLYAAAATATVVTIVVLYVLKSLENGLFPRVQGRQLLVFTSAGTSVPATVSAVETVVGNLQVTRVSTTDDGGLAIGMHVAAHPEEDVGAVAERLLLLEEITGIELRR